MGPWGFAKDYTRIGRTIDQVLGERGAVQLRIPCHIGGEVWRRLSRRRPYGVEVVGDPYEVFAPGSVRHVLRPFFRLRPRGNFAVSARARARGRTSPNGPFNGGIQPAPERSPRTSRTLSYPKSPFVSAPRSTVPSAASQDFDHGRLPGPAYKAPDVLLDAVAVCVKADLDLRLRIVGDGKFRPELQARAGALGLGERAIFCGQVTAGEPVRRELDQADLFVLASHQEGLPRAMIEAMARALPCIGSSVGGIPELLSPGDLVPPGDASALARKIREVVTDPERMERMSVRNLGKAREYTGETLGARRIRFYEHVRAETTCWLQSQSASTSVACAASSAV